jgi:hypothetical protein
MADFMDSEVVKLWNLFPVSRSRIKIAITTQLQHPNHHLRSCVNLGHLAPSPVGRAQGLVSQGSGFESDLFHKAYYMPFSCRWQFEIKLRIVNLSRAWTSSWTPPPQRAVESPTTRNFRTVSTAVACYNTMIMM